MPLGLLPLLAPAGHAEAVCWGYVLMMYSATIAEYMVRGKQNMGEPIDFELAEAFADFLPRFKRWIEHLLPPGGPTAVRVRLLGMVHCEGPQKMSGLATALGITARRVTALADALEEEGLVTRGPDPRDRRVTWITLTDTGVATVDRLYEAHREAAAALFDELTPDRKAELLQTVRELSQRLNRPDADARRGVGVAV